MLAIFGLYFQLLLTAVAIPAAFAAMLPGNLPDGYTLIVICTGEGMKRITVDADGTPVGETTQDMPAKQCAACYVVGGGVFIDQPVSQQVLLANSFGLVKPPFELACTHKASRIHTHSRAPPLEL